MTGASRTANYQPTDRLYVWLLTQPQRPIPVGEIHLVRTTQGVSLRYFESWLQRGFALSEDLPLIDQEFLPAEKSTAAGAIDDARPDRWGERVIRVLDKPPRLSLLEYLYFAGDDRFGALGVSTSAETYLPRRLGPLPLIDEADQIHELVRKVQANEPVPAAQQRLRLSRNEALEEVRAVARVVDRWQRHFRECGVTAHDIELCAEQIDRPFLVDQRRAYATG